MLAKHRPKGLEEHLDVNLQTAIAHIKQLERLTFAALVLGVIARYGLPPAGDARRHGEKLDYGIVIGHELVGFDGARTDDAHLALEYVPELRNLIERSLAQKLANLGNTWIVVNFVFGLPLLDLLGGEVLLDLISPHHHRAQLVDVDGRTVTPNTALGIPGSSSQMSPHTRSVGIAQATDAHAENTTSKPRFTT